MTNLEDTLKHFKSVRLAPDARLRMREELSAYADLHAYVEPDAYRPPRSLSMRLYAGFAAVALIMVGVGGTAYASEKTLPGDMLYPFKVRVAEPVQTALLPDDHGRAVWHAILAERRLNEAAQLASQDQLSEDVQEDLATNLSKQVSASILNADQLEDSGDMLGALSVRSDLEARLTAHDRILSVIAGHYASTTPQDAPPVPARLALQDLIATVRVHEEAVATSRIALEDALLPEPAAATPSPAPVLAKAATLPSAHTPAPALVAADAHEYIAQSAKVRTEGVEQILQQHATLLAKFLPAASTTSSTSSSTLVITATSSAGTATGTASSTPGE